jgi:hypothetical protein
VDFEPVLDNECEWKHVFLLYSESRPFRLYAQSQGDRNTWVAILKYIIAQGKVEIAEANQEAVRRMIHSKSAQPLSRNVDDVITSKTPYTPPEIQERVENFVKLTPTKEQKKNKVKISPSESSNSNQTPNSSLNGTMLPQNLLTGK